MKKIATLSVLMLGLGISPVHAVDQTVLGKKFSIKNPSTADRRQVKGSAKEGPGSDDTIGPTNNPTVSGASLEVIANGATPSDQTFSLPASGWSAIGPLGYKFSNKSFPPGTNPVKKASIKRTSSGVFSIKINIKGSNGTVIVVPPNPGDNGGFILTITDRFCVGFGGAWGGFEKKDDARAWQIQNPGAEAGCPVPGAPVTTTTVTSTTNTTAPGATTTSVTVTTVTTTTATTIPGCDCCASSVMGALLSFTTGQPTPPATDPPTGSVAPARCVQGSNNGVACASDATCTGGGVCRGHLDSGGLYFGGGQPSGLNLPALVPDRGLSYSKVAPCIGGVPQLAPTAEADVPGPGCPAEAGTPSYGMRHCTSPGCLFGPPLSIPNAATTATSTCVVNSIANEPGAGTGTVICGGGATNLDLPLTSTVYLTGPVLGAQACATCTGGTPGVCASGTCNGGTRDGMSCTPETSALNASYPTSHDCPPPAGTSIGSLPIAFALSTGTQVKNSFDPNGVSDPGQGHDRTFCGFCYDPLLTASYENPPNGCDMDSDCTNGNFTQCRQHSDGAFRNTFATTITETGIPPAACMLDEMPHAATLVSVFCVPPSYNGIVDPSGELPGPGAVSLPGTAQLIVP